MKPNFVIKSSKRLIMAPRQFLPPTHGMTSVTDILVSTSKEDVTLPNVPKSVFLAFKDI